MGLFSRKGSGEPRESRGARKDREMHERIDQRMDDARKACERAGTERTAAFWEDYERRNGPGSVDWS